MQFNKISLVFSICFYLASSITFSKGHSAVDSLIDQLNTADSEQISNIISDVLSTKNGVFSSEELNNLVSYYTEIITEESIQTAAGIIDDSNDDQFRTAEEVIIALSNNEQVGEASIENFLNYDVDCETAKSLTVPDGEEKGKAKNIPRKKSQFQLSCDGDEQRLIDVLDQNQKLQNSSTLKDYNDLINDYLNKQRIQTLTKKSSSSNAIRKSIPQGTLCEAHLIKNAFDTWLVNHPLNAGVKNIGAFDIKNCSEPNHAKVDVPSHLICITIKNGSQVNCVISLENNQEMNYTISANHSK